MTESAELTHAVMARLTQFVRRLSPEDLAALAAGTVQLGLVRSATPAPASTARELPVPADDVRAVLGAMPDRAEAVRYLDGLRLTTPQLRALAKGLNLAVATKATKTELRDTIVQWTVGRRVDASVLSRPGGSRP